MTGGVSFGELLQKAGRWTRDSFDSSVSSFDGGPIASRIDRHYSTSGIRAVANGNVGWTVVPKEAPTRISWISLGLW